jgi:hypothetical protein
MAQTGYTPISIYYSATSTNTPTAGNLVAGELAINTADGKLFYKDSSGVVQTIATKGAGTVAGSTGYVQYNNGGSLASSSNFYWDITNSRLGIGTTSPAYPLDVNGNTRINAAILVAGDISQSGTNVITNSTNSLILKTNTANPIIFQPNASEAMRINSSGYLLVGTTTAPSVANMATGYSTTSYWQYGASTTGSGNFWVLNSSNTGVALVNGNTAWQAQSDARLKNVIGKYETPLADIAQIEAVKFTWKADLTNKPQVGVLAQSVKSVVPESVETAKLPSSSDKTEYLSVKYTELIPLMIASIQELSSKVTALEAQLGVK